MKKIAFALLSLSLVFGAMSCSHSAKHAGCTSCADKKEVCKDCAEKKACTGACKETAKDAKKSACADCKS